MATWNVIREGEIIDRVEFIDSATELFVLNVLKRDQQRFWGDIKVSREGGNTVHNKPGLTVTQSRIGVLESPGGLGRDEFLKVTASIPITAEEVHQYYKYTEYGTRGIPNCLTRRVLPIPERACDFVVVLEHRNA